MTSYYEDLTTRGYEAGPSRRVPLPMVFQYLEHLRWRCIIDPASGLGDFVDRGFFFVVQKQRLVLHRGFGQDTDLRAFMGCTKVGRSAIDITHEVRRRSDGAVMASAEVTGLWLGPNRRLTRIPDELRAFVEGLGPIPPVDMSTVTLEDHSERLESSYIRPPDLEFPTGSLAIDAPTEADIPADAMRYVAVVRPSDLDIFSHVNAATYLRFCDDARAACSGILGELGTSPAYRAAIHYARETLQGEEVTVHTWPIGNTEVGFALVAGGTVRCTARMDIAIG